MRLILLPGLLLLGMGCAGPIQELWPPALDSPAHEIIVSVDTWHAVIAISRAEKNSEASGVRREGSLGTTEPSVRALPRFSELSADPLRLTPHASRPIYEEWSYAEEAWYLEGRQGFSGALRALFWPSPGVIEVGFHDVPWSERTPDPPAEQFRFRLSTEGYLRLRQFLEASRRSQTPLRSSHGRTFYLAHRAYSVFHQCHHYAARALRAAGLPVAPGWVITPSLFIGQLRRSERLAAEAVHAVILKPEAG